MAKFEPGDENKPSRQPKKGQKIDKRSLVEAIEVVEPRCKVCKSEHRHQMENLMMAGRSLSSIAKFFEQLGDDVNRKNLATHRDNHMALEKAGIATAIAQRWREQVSDPDKVEDSAQFYMTKQGMLEAMLQKAWERIRTDEAEWRPQDVIQIMQYLERLEAQHTNVALDEVMLEARAFTDAVKAIVPRAMWEEIVAKFDQNVDFARHPIRAIETTATEESNG